MKISVGVSNRHVHLTEKDLNTLFGDNYELEFISPLNQPGQFASNSFVTIAGPKGQIEHVRVLGPIRLYTQVEISKTDSYKLGINPPIRDSGDLQGSSPITIIGPKGRVDLKEGCIIATRHIHILPKQAIEYGLMGKKEVCVRIGGEKASILEHVHVKIADKSYFEIHLDTDDANACLLKNNDIVDIII